MFACSPSNKKFIAPKAADELTDKTIAINGMWQTDFTYFKIIGWGWFYLSTILDDYSRYIIDWKLCTNMRAEDVKVTIELVLAASGCDHADVRHMPRLLSDNSSVTSPVIWPNGWKITKWITFAVHPSTRKPKARSSVGIKQ